MKMMVALVFYIFLLHCQFLSAQENPEVVTQHGTIIGRIAPTPLGVNVEVFQGIPYAAPPIGSGRFSNPEPYGEFPGGVWLADDFGNSCVQAVTDDYPNVAPVSEDCLFLNIWRPETYQDNRAVMVWIYGGGFTIGSTSQGYYEGGVLSAFGDVIVVSINYRLGFFGFFHTGDDRMPNGNQGLLDQQLALQWVQENIRAFGGDPKQVTIFGESAGGASVNHLLLMPGSEDLFNRAILQSGVSTSYWAAQSMETISVTADWIANQTGCSNDDTFLDCLRDIPADELLNETTTGNEKPLFSHDAPVADGVTIPDRPLDMMQAGQMHKKDVLLGFNKDEGSWFIYIFPGVNPNSVVEDPNGTYALVVENHFALLRNLTEAEIADVLEAYLPAEEDGDDKAKISISNIYGDVAFLCPIQQVARLFDQYGMNVYQYYLTYRAKRSTHPEWQGVRHGDDVQWVFGFPYHETVDYDDEELVLAMEVMTKWTDFAKYGSPDTDWPTYSSADGAAYAEIRGPSDFVYVTGEDVRGEFCDLWNFD